MSAELSDDEFWRAYADQISLLHQGARSRFAMYAGHGSDVAHWRFIDDVLRYFQTRGFFRRPGDCVISLAPEQYAVICQGGPLVRPIQKMFPFGVRRLLTEDWFRLRSELSNAKHQSIERLSESERAPKWKRELVWSSDFGVDGPERPRDFSRHLVWGIRTDAGLWCQAFRDGFPVAPSFLLMEPANISVFAIAWLDKQWFTNLPFTPADAEGFAARSHVSAAFHETNNLLPEDALSPDGLRRHLLALTNQLPA